MKGLGVLVLVAAAFFAGYKARPRMTAEVMATWWAKYGLGREAPKRQLDTQRYRADLGVNYPRQLAISSAEDIAARRRALAAYLWRGGENVWSQRPAQVEPRIFYAPLADIPNLASVDRLRVTMPPGIDSLVYFLHADQPRDCLMVYQEGHRHSFLEHKEFIRRMVREGCDVLALSLPLTAPINPGAEISHPRFGELRLDEVDDLELLDSEKRSSLHYFFTPVIVALNHALAAHSYGHVGMAGFSGGGWVTVMTAALDPRIQASYVIAGTAPTPVLAAVSTWGSFEQREARMYEIATYLELYFMGSAGPGRRQIQFFNEIDPCCYSGTGWHGYGRVISERLGSLGGAFKILGYQAPRHDFGKPVSLTILDDFLNGGVSPAQGIRPID